MPHARVEASASDPVTTRAKIAADIKEVRDEMRSRGVSATDGAVTLGCIVAKHEAEILAALAPAAVPESVRRLSEEDIARAIYSLDPDTIYHQFGQEPGTWQRAYDTDPKKVQAKKFAKAINDLLATPSSVHAGEAVSAPASAGAVPAGWRLVPVEATDAMMDAAGKCLEDGLDRSLVGGEGPHLADIWRAYRDAAPVTPEPAAGGREIVRLNFALGREGLFYVTSPDVKGFLVTEHSLDAALLAIPRAFADLARAGACVPAILSASTADGETAGDCLSQAARDVLAERRRQVEVEGWMSEHDDQHISGAMALAAASYAYAAASHDPSRMPGMWPWARSWWKPGTVRRMLVKAGALILAEIERLDRKGPNLADHQPPLTPRLGPARPRQASFMPPDKLDAFSRVQAEAMASRYPAEEPRDPPAPTRPDATAEDATPAEGR